VRRRYGRRRYGLWILLSLFLVVAVSAGLVFFRPFASKRSPRDSGVADLTPLPGERMTVLVMGVDKRPDDVGRSDSMIVVSYSPQDRRLALLSLPRDTWVQIPGYGYDKLNHSYAYGGEELAVATVEQLLGIPIDHYVSFSFQGFQRVIDALGGIEINAEKRMLYVDPFDTSMGPDGLVIDIQPGPQVMDGETALKYARFRMDEEGDLGRIRRQQQVIRAIIQKASQPSVIPQLPGLVTALVDAVDTDMSLSEMLKLAKGAKNVLSSNLVMGVLPGTAQDIGGISYQISDLVEARIMAYRLLVGVDPPEEFVAKARADQLAYEEALEKAIAAAHATQPEEQQPADGQNASPDGTGDGPGTEKPGTGDGAGNAGDSGPDEGAGGGDGDGDESDDGTDIGTHPAPRTVHLVDASGQNLADAYVALINNAGYQVVGVSTSPQVLSTSVALDHGGQAAGLQGVIPTLLVVSVPDPGNPAGIEVILGRDLVQ